MLDNAALFGSRRRVILVVLASFGIAALLAVFAFVAIRLHETYEIQSELVILKSNYHNLQLICSTNQTEQKERLDRVWQVLYGDVVPKVEKVHVGGVLPQTRIERGVDNSLKDLRKRVEKLEKDTWRLRRIVE